MTIINVADYGPGPASADITGFEGPEKRLEVCFQVNLNDTIGLRSINQEQWQTLLDNVNCLIISKTSNQFMDSYVLSESSLFVYPYKILLKTCGTTTLLNCLPMLKEYAAKCNTEIELLVFSRKNYNFPDKQKLPHLNFHTEVARLQESFSGSAHIVGPIMSKSDHHYVYIAGKRSNVNTPASHEYLTRPTVEILMSELHPEAMRQFFRNEDYVDAKTVTIKSGQASLLPAVTTDEVMFDPCGFSLNGISDNEDSYFTVHVTPEAHCSFVSFETNASVATNVSELVEKVTRIFRPGRFSLVVSCSDKDSVSLPSRILPGFLCKYRSTEELEGGLTLTCCNYTKNQPNQLGG